ncbi:MAG TPA: type II secretion system protein GspM [Candidatus Binatia bacterium]|jgi:general secretion pathway protein M|nr:type II secretion system protein GspM [Candidatus Binatia bacterium]
MRLKQLWQRLSARERILAGTVLLALLLVVVRYGIVEPYLTYTAHLEEEIEQEAQRVAKMQRQRSRREQIAIQVNALRQHFREMRQRLIPGGTPALAAAHLQERIQTLASQSGLELVTTQVMRDEAVGEFRKIAVQVTLRGELPAVADFVAGVEYGDWLLAVMTLEVRSTYNLRMRPREGPRNPLTITLEVGGVMQGAETSVAMQEG